MKLLLIVCMSLAPAFCQTQLDLGNQSKNIDFSGKSMVRPFREGALLPATCLTGEMFFLTTATAGSNSYGCTAPNTWTIQGGSSTLASAPLQVTLADNTDLQVGSGCTTGSECAVRVGSVTYFYAAPATISIQSGTGAVFIYVNSAGAITAGTSAAGSPALTCSGCQVLNPVTQFPDDSIPLAIWNATSGVWSATGTDEHALLSGGRTFVAGQNIILTESGSTVTISATGSTPAVTGSGGSSGVYSPTDMTTFDRDYVFAEQGYTSSAWNYAGGCGASGATPGVAGELPGIGWGTNSYCLEYYPGANGGNFPFVDFISGAAPLSYMFEARYALSSSDSTPAATHYVGWSSTKDNTFADFVGFRYVSSANVWECLIRSGGADVASAVLPVTPDGGPHTLTVTNGGIANSVGCTIDAGSTTTTGTIPSTPWYGVMGAVTTGGGASFATFEARIQISGINR